MIPDVAEVDVAPLSVQTKVEAMWQVLAWPERLRVAWPL
jgi:hypothetical protein